MRRSSHQKKVWAWRISTLLAGSILQLAGGTLYSFSLYSGELKLLFRSQTAVSLLGSAGHLGNYSGMVIGAVYDRFGPAVTALVSGILVCVGYAVLSFTLRGWIPASLPLLLVCMFGIGQGSHGSYTASLMTNVKNFSPARRGMVVGYLASLFALSSAVLTAMYALLSAQDFLLLLASLLLVANFLYIPTARVVGPPSADVADESSGDEELVPMPPEGAPSVPASAMPQDELLNPFDMDPVAAGPHDLTAPPKPLSLEEQRRLDAASVASSPAIRMPRSRILPPPRRPAPQDLVSMNGEETVPEDGMAFDEEESGLPDDETGVVVENNVTGLRLLRDGRFWLIFGMFFVSGGSGLTFIDQLRQQVEAVTTSTDSWVSSGLVVVVLSLCNGLGRIVAGVLSDALVHVGVGRILCLVAYVYFMGLATLVLALAVVPELVLLGACLVGLAYGGLYALVPALNSALFGLRHFGQNQGWMVLAPGCGGFLLNLMTSSFYDYHAEEVDVQGASELQCRGASCFLAAYAILAALNAALATTGLLVLFLHPMGKRIRQLERSTVTAPPSSAPSSS